MIAPQKIRLIPLTDVAALWFVVRYPKASKLNRKRIEGIVCTKIVMTAIYALWGLNTTKRGKRLAAEMKLFGKKYSRSNASWLREFELLTGTAAYTAWRYL